ncbi:hypothetical protein FKX85_04430 [Echinicola soli]|uniref:DUF6787 domain-containing protein n=1 Tax=Echinicola soli TaxID=2591634 RepID=A0A514CEP7_9BACT|nr:DUF6787 family protein [Echinicola soli]QDH78325.1 hypothetical protein FKX85_04430 [Echinicola soli]
MNEEGFLKRLQQKWQLKSIWQVLLVLLAFACTGFTVLYIKQPIFDLLGVDMSSGGFWKTVIYLLLVLPLYQIMLLFYGFLFGQFSFFWEKEKKIFKRIGALLIRKRK